MLHIFSYNTIITNLIIGDKYKFEAFADVSSSRLVSVNPASTEFVASNITQNIALIIQKDTDDVIVLQTKTINLTKNIVNLDQIIVKCIEKQLCSDTPPQPLPTPTVTSTQINTITKTPTPTNSPTTTTNITITPTKTQSPTPNITPHITSTPTKTPTPTTTPIASITPTNTIALGSSPTPTKTLTNTPTASPTPTITKILSITPTASTTSSNTPTITTTPTKLISPITTCVPCNQDNWRIIKDTAFSRNIAMSDNGMVIFILEKQSYPSPNPTTIFKSIDGGLSWIDITTNLGSYNDINSLTIIRCSNDGNIVVLTGENAITGQLVLAKSSNAGSSWDIKQKCSGSSLCSSLGRLDMSGNGQILVGASHSQLFYGSGSLNTSIYVSENYGASWLLRYTIPANINNNVLVSDVCISDDGSVMGVACYTGDSMNASYVYMSRNKGQSWTQTTLPYNNYSAIACSADGNTVVAASLAGIYVSTDQGITWLLTSAPQIPYNDIAISSDGTYIVGVTYPNNRIYCSNNRGVSWTPTENNRFWDNIVISRNSDRIIASTNNDKLYLNSCNPITPTPTITPTSTPTSTIKTTTTPTPTPTATKKIINSDDYVICFTDECDPGYVKASDGSVGDNWIPDSDYWNNNMTNYNSNNFTMFHVSRIVGTTGSWTFSPSGSSTVWPSVSAIAPYNKTPIPITLTKRPDSSDFSYHDLFLFLKSTFETKYGPNIWNILASNKNRVLVFVDISGSMDRDTIGIGLDLFYYFLDSYCVMWKEYGCNNERWIKWLVDASLNIVNCSLNKESTTNLSCTSLPITNTPTKSITPTKLTTRTPTPTPTSK